jgi:NTE family protein
MKRLMGVLRSHIGDVRMEDAEVKLALVATDIASGERVVMTRGELATAAAASACVPGVFIPVKRDGRLLVDGGLVENLPVGPLREWGVRPILAVDVHMGRTFHPPRNIGELLSNTLDIALAAASRHTAGDADLLIAPDTSSWSRKEMDDIPALIAEGYRSAQEPLNRMFA